MVSFGNAFRYLQLNSLYEQLCLTGHSIVSQFISLLTMARCKPVGSRPIARQNNTTCITGNAKMKSITLQSKKKTKGVRQKNFYATLKKFSHFKFLTLHFSTYEGNFFGAKLEFCRLLSTDNSPLTRRRLLVHPSAAFCRSYAV